MSETLTKEQAIAESKELWQEIEASGKSKQGFLDAPEGRIWRKKHYRGHCPLCEYAKLRDPIDGCFYCPLVLQYGKKCFSLGFSGYVISSPEWFEAVRNL